MAMSDGHIIGSELALLAKARGELGISEERHAVILEAARNSATGTPWYSARFLTLFKITVQFVQIFGMITQVYSGVGWTASYRSFSGSVRIFSSNPFQLFLPSCIDDSMMINGYGQFRLALALPFAGCLGIFLFYVATFRSALESAYCKEHTCEKKGCINEKRRGDKFCARNKCGRNQASAVPAEDGVCLHHAPNRIGTRCVAPRMVTGKQQLRAVCISTAALFYFLLFPTMTVNSVRMLAECQTLCTDTLMQNCTSYLRSDYSITCGTEAHSQYFIVAAIVFALIALGTPVLLGYTLWARRAEFLAQAADSFHYDPLATPSSLSLGFSFFYKPFKSSLIFWESVELTYKLSMTAIITFIAPDTPFQVYAGICFAGFFWVLDAVFQPFESRAENVLAHLRRILYIYGL